LVELLVVVAIIGALAGLLMPAIQGAREAARRSQCANHAKQLALACLTHEAALGHYPTGGWGFQWIGEPDAGYGKNQPGSWAYNLLAYLEQAALRQLGAGVFDLEARQSPMMKLIATPLATFNCPSKRPLQTYRLDDRGGAQPVLAVNTYACTPGDCQVVRGDYRANAGNIWAGDSKGPGPREDMVKYWNDRVAAGSELQSGVSYLRSTVHVSQVTDGTSRTYLLGEKALNPDNYLDGRYTADDQCLYSGHDNDNVGYTGRKSDEIYAPVADYPPRNIDTKFRFGGPHAEGFNMALCDGAVTFVSYDIEPRTFWLLGGRDDGEE